jgi:zinc and cadmium transporter
LLIAAAFLADPMLGVTTTLAVVAHEIPQELGDFVLLLNAGWSRRKAFLANAASSLTSVLGGLPGHFALDGAEQFLPYVLVLAIAAASFIYIAVADLLPLLHRQRSSFALQSALIGLGVMVVPLVGQWVHCANIDARRFLDKTTTA